MAWAARKSILVFFGVLALSAAGACSSGHGGPPDGSSRDGLTYDLSLDLPPGCPPAQGNEKGVGAPCTRGGHECTGNLVCACDTVDGLTLNGVPCICTLAGLNTKVGAEPPPPCSSQSADVCGSGATCCNYGTIAYYCSPNVCLPGGACIDFTSTSGN